MSKGVYGCLWVSVDAYRCNTGLWVFIGVYGCLWMFMGVHGFVWVSMGIYAFLG